MKNKIKIGYLGPAGTYTEKAAKAYSKNKAEIINYNSIEEVFKSVAEKQANLGVVPLENIVQGIVTETLDSLFEYSGRIFITDSLIIPISHYLGALKNQGKIEKILSKDQALRQCSRYLSKNYRDAELIETKSTAAAVEMITKGNLVNSAAIADKEKILSYGLEIIAEDIGNVQDNKTKFAILGTKLRKKTEKDTTSLVIYPHKDRVGLLDDMLQVISRDYKLNLSSIHSRPDSKGKYRFYMDLEGHVDDVKISSCLRALKEKIKRDNVEIKILGSYPKKDL